MDSVTTDSAPHSSIRALKAQVGWFRVGGTPHLRTSLLSFKEPSGRTSIFHQPGSVSCSRVYQVLSISVSRSPFRLHRRLGLHPVALRPEATGKANRDGDPFVEPERRLRRHTPHFVVKPPNPTIGHRGCDHVRWFATFLHPTGELHPVLIQPS